MSSIAHLLEDFATHVDTEPVILSDVALEEYRLEAYENGYRAGWEDCARTEAEEARHVTADLARNMRDLDFTYQEAHAALMAQMRPLLEEMAAQVLPRLARQTLAPRIAELLQRQAERLGRQPVMLQVGPEDRPALTHLAGTVPDLDVTISEDPTLGKGQVRIRFGTEEQAIDMAALLAAIDEAINGFFEEHRKEIA